MQNIIVTSADHTWLKILAEQISSSAKDARGRLRALEYFYRAWATDASERFPILCMSLDSVFGSANQSTRAVIEGVQRVLGLHIEEGRLRQLMELLASVIHGGAPDVYDSRKYARYYNTFSADPIRDLDIILVACLRRVIFGDAMTEHAGPSVAPSQNSSMFPLAGS